MVERKDVGRPDLFITDVPRGFRRHESASRLLRLSARRLAQASGRDHASLAAEYNGMAAKVSGSGLIERSEPLCAVAQH